MTEKKDTSPMVKSRRIKRLVRIQEENIPPSSLFDTTVEYPSDDLPEWFAPLQPVIEDETFTSMRINLGDKVHYHITLAEDFDRRADLYEEARLYQHEEMQRRRKQLNGEQEDDC